MSWTCLVVDFDDHNIEEDGDFLDKLHHEHFDTRATESSEDAITIINDEDVALVIIFGSEFDERFRSVLTAFQGKTGGIPELQAVICDEPEPNFLAQIFEYGIDQVHKKVNWVDFTIEIMKEAYQSLKQEDSSESRSLRLMKAIKDSDRKGIAELVQTFKDDGDYDFRATFAHGKALEASGDYAGAIETYAKGKELNKMFRPTATRMGENLIVTGRIDEAIAIFEELEASNALDPERKAFLATAYTEKGDFKKAEQLTKEAAELSPLNNKVLEAKAQLLMKTGKINEAVAMLDQMDQVGPFFASRLNDLGIKLSKAGKGKTALALYTKAHKIVKPELKYKITLNLALACRRLKAFEKALKYIQRCREEYGDEYPKLDKIEKSIKVEYKQAKAQKNKAS